MSCQEVGHALGLDHQDEYSTMRTVGHVHGLHEQLVDKPASDKHDYDQLLHLFAPRQQTQPSMWGITQTDLPRQCKTFMVSSLFASDQPMKRRPRQQ